MNNEFRENLMNEQDKNIDEIGEIALKLRDNANDIGREVDMQNECFFNFHFYNTTPKNLVRAWRNS